MFAIRNALLRSIMPTSNCSERILKIQWQTATHLVSLLSIYAPMSIWTIQHQHIIWNGEGLLEFCTAYHFCVTNAFFHVMYLGRHPRSKHWHQLDLVVIWCRSIGDVKLTWSFQSAACDISHSLLCNTVRPKPRKNQKSKMSGKWHINTNNTHSMEMVEQFNCTLEAKPAGPLNMAVSERWTNLRDAVYVAASTVFGVRWSDSADWFVVNQGQILPVMDEKRHAPLAYKNCPMEGKLSSFLNCSKLVKNTTRQCTNDFWIKLCRDIKLQWIREMLWACTKV